MMTTHAASSSGVLAILQARMSSSRLPGKVLKPILGKAMLALQLERLQRVQSIDHIIVATSDGPEDDVIADQCASLSIACYQGDLNNVLHRFYRAAKQYKSHECQLQHIVRLTGDCPLISPSIIDNVIEQHVRSDAVYTSNCYPATLPDGLDMEIFTWEALKQAEEEATSDFDREHVTPYIRNVLAEGRQGYYVHEPDLSALRWTVDYPDDFVLVSKIFSSLYPENPKFELADILDFLAEHPELKQINSHHILKGTTE